jgi:hypothetical protein
MTAVADWLESALLACIPVAYAAAFATSVGHPQLQQVQHAGLQRCVLHPAVNKHV